jgi:hypothetical protein
MFFNNALKTLVLVSLPALIQGQADTSGFALNPIFAADLLYDSTYLATLSAQERAAALETKYFSADPAKGGVKEILRKDTGNGQLPYTFVYKDPRNKFYNDWYHPLQPEGEIIYGIKPRVGETGGYASYTVDMSEEDQDFWFRESLQKWKDSSKCADPPIVTTQIPFPGAPSLVEYAFATGIINIGLRQADIVQVGFRGSEFSYFAENPNVLGVTFTLSWLDEQGYMSDIDNNRKDDAALVSICRYKNERYLVSKLTIASIYL